MNPSSTTILGAAIFLTLATGLVEAEIRVTTSKSADASPPTVSAVDLAQTAYVGSSATGVNDVATFHANLFDGDVGTSTSGTGGGVAVTMDNENTFTVDLDVSTNTQGYDITQIDSFFGWNPAAGGRSNQGYEIVLTFVNDSTETLVGPTHWEPNAPADYWTTVSFSEIGGGPLFSDTVDLNGGGAVAGSSVTATGVKAITFSISEIAPPGGVVVAREIDIFGIPTGSEHVVDRFVNVGPSTEFETAELSTDKRSSFRIGGASDDLAVVTDLDGLSVVMGVGSTHVIDINPQGTLAPGTYPLIDYVGTIGGLGFAGLELGDIGSGGRPYVASLVDNTVDTRVDLSITSGGPADLVWTAVIDTTWDLDTTANWQSATGGGSAAFFTEDRVIFDDTVGSGTVVLSGTIAPGAVDIDNSTMDYTFDGDPITGSTSVSKDGAGSVTFNNANDFSGGLNISQGTVIIGDGGALGTGPIINDGSLVAQPTGDMPLDSPISGSGGLIKSGTGTLILDDPGTDNTFTGDTFINEGTVIAGPGNGDVGLSLNSAVYLGATSGIADATLQFDQGSSTVFPGTINYTVQTGNTGITSIHGSGYSQVQGMVTLGSAGSNGKDLNLAQIGNPEWELRLQGVIQDPENMTPGTAGTITIGSNNNGEVVFEAANTYAGDTLVAAGKLFVRSGGSMTFYPNANGSTNQLLGTAPNTGEVTLDAPITLDLSGADATPGNSWPLIGSVPDDFAVLTYGEAFGVTSNLGAFTESAGRWSLTDAGNLWIFSEATGTLTVRDASSNDYGTWVAGFGELTDSDPSLDFESDGLDTGIEYVVGGNPTSNDAGSLAPTFTSDGSDFEFTFRRTDLANGDPNTTIVVQYGSDLAGWTTAEDGSDGVSISENNDFYGAGVDQVIVTLPSGLTVSGELFARLSVTIL